MIIHNNNHPRQLFAGNSKPFSLSSPSSHDFFYDVLTTTASGSSLLGIAWGSTQTSSNTYAPLTLFIFQQFGLRVWLVGRVVAVGDNEALWQATDIANPICYDNMFLLTQIWAQVSSSPPPSLSLSLSPSAVVVNNHYYAQEDMKISHTVPVHRIQSMLNRLGAPLGLPPNCSRREITRFLRRFNPPLSDDYQY